MDKAIPDLADAKLFLPKSPVHGLPLHVRQMSVLRPDRVIFTHDTKEAIQNKMDVCGQEFWPLARRDEEAYPRRSVTEAQRSQRSKEPAQMFMLF